ncbi:altronate hydrolase/altronate dehydratase small subunit [Maritalea mobilis]|uniref:Altronate hydrolase/altronate dehydratase small subunit n=1 Tax=Maritalea mobilis TaxID=483324 RepID=A0A4R6VQC3_9HYPH|nr:SAF domain-containing protein [Maritalea mobilis]TDQ64416.1 altronate hydrolase/altronate dehydratase small subunit [Maritalea mobilis]
MVSKEAKGHRETDARLLLLNNADNVLSVARPIRFGQLVSIEGNKISLDHNAGVGSKIARCRIKQGDEIMQSGAFVGIATKSIKAGQLIHAHNSKPNTI